MISPSNFTVNVYIKLYYAISLLKTYFYDKCHEECLFMMLDYCEFTYASVHWTTEDRSWSKTNQVHLQSSLVPLITKFIDAVQLCVLYVEERFEPIICNHNNKNSMLAGRMGTNGTQH